MIKLKRGRPPASVGGRGSAGFAERTEALAHFARLRRKPFKFKVYKRDDVRDALNSAFGYKCGYCEGRYWAFHPVEVEHYRPKSGVRRGGVLTKPGYYWLAAEWTNFLPSCIDCNRERKQEVFEGGKWQSVVCGKATGFPLANRRMPRIKPGCEQRELPLLLNPCDDDPARYLQFDENGVVRPRSGLHARNRAKAIATIATVGLLRRGLVQEREAKAKLVMGRIEQIKRLLGASGGRTSRGVAVAIGQDLEELKRFCDASAPHAAVARSLVAQHLSPALVRKSKATVSSVARATPRKTSRSRKKK